METKTIDFGVKESIERIRKEQGHVLSSHAFASLYLWKEQMGLSLYMKNEMFSAKCTWKGENVWFFPCGDENGKKAFVTELLQQSGRLIYLRTEDKEWLELHYPNQWVFTRDENSDEYLYGIEEQLSLSGRFYANERTQVHKVERELQTSIRILEEENLKDAYLILEEWDQKERKVAGCNLQDSDVDRLALAERMQLGIEGIVMYLEDKPIAIVAGFPLTEDTFDIAVAKTSISLQGVAYYSKRELMKQVKERYRWMNLEEDLGLEGLRTMKQLMSPVKKNLIWEATLL